MHVGHALDDDAAMLLVRRQARLSAAVAHRRSRSSQTETCAGSSAAMTDPRRSARHRIQVHRVLKAARRTRPRRRPRRSGPG